MNEQSNPWDEHADEFAQWINAREPVSLHDGDMLSRLLDLLGDIDGRDVLDAGCGEGFFSRILAARGACVTGIDLSPRLIEIARRKDPDQGIDYRVADLSKPLPGLHSRFPVIASYLVLNDVRDVEGFAATLASLLAPGGRLALSLNNPYSSVVRDHITDYFDADAIGTYSMLSEYGARISHFHRPLEGYLDAFLRTGLRLTKLADVIDLKWDREWLLPKGYRFPLFMILAFDKPKPAATRV